MIFSEPPRTAYDLHFTLFGVPVRVHPFFWLAMLMLGPFGDPTPQTGLVWVVAAFISILMHEFGHVWAIRYYGSSAHIVLHGFGGLAIQNSTWQRDSKSQIVISLAGPIAGFLLAGTIIAGLMASGVRVEFFNEPLPFGLMPEFSRLPGIYLNLFVFCLLYANIFWGVFNLLPIFPLDGGQVAMAFFQLHDQRDGMRRAFQLSIVTAALLLIYALSERQMFMAVFFGYLAYQNYQNLQQLRGRFPGSPW